MCKTWQRPMGNYNIIQYLDPSFPLSRGERSLPIIRSNSVQVKFQPDIRVPT